MKSVDKTFNQMMAVFRAGFKSALIEHRNKVMHKRDHSIFRRNKYKNDLADIDQLIDIIENRDSSAELAAYVTDDGIEFANYAMSTVMQEFMKALSTQTLIDGFEPPDDPESK